LIFGARRGIGTAIFKTWESSGWNVSTIERGQWDPSNPETLRELLTKYQFDLVIINAHVGYYLGPLLEYLMYVSKQSCDIIILGSMASLTQRQHYYAYQLEKKHYDECVRQFQMQFKDRMITLFRPGLTDTELVREKDGVKMDPSIVATIIWDLYQMSKTHHISFISSSFTASTHG